MTYVITQPCVDVLDKACIDECPVDCIYEGDRMLCIHPDECVDYGPYESACPVKAMTTRTTSRTSGRTSTTPTWSSSPTWAARAARPRRARSARTARWSRHSRRTQPLADRPAGLVSDGAVSQTRD